jgi:hypothetical protein
MLDDNTLDEDDGGGGSDNDRPCSTWLQWLDDQM